MHILYHTLRTSEVTELSLRLPIPLFLSSLWFPKSPFLEMGQKDDIVAGLCVEQGIFPLPC